jgi:hypothetical protein
MVFTVCVFTQVTESRSAVVAMNTATDHDQDNLTSTDSEWDRSLSFLDGASALDSLIGPRTSTPTNGGNIVDLSIFSGDDSQSLPESIQSVSSPDSGSVTPPDFSILACDGLSSEETNVQSSQSQLTNLEDRGVGQPTSSAIRISAHHYHPRPGYKVVIDNIDKNVKPRDMRIDSQTKSLHYVQLYGVKDRVDFSSLSNIPKAGEMCLYDILPSTEDYQKLKENLSILVARTMTDNLSFFSKDFKSLVPRHVPHQYSREMSAKSEVVSCNYLTYVYKCLYIHAT